MLFISDKFVGGTVESFLALYRISHNRVSGVFVLQNSRRFLEEYRRHIFLKRLSTVGTEQQKL
jgi:hypothetical protein